MKKYISTLKKCPLFEGISADDILRILTCFNVKVKLFDKKHTVFSEETPAMHVGIVLSGEVQIIQNDYFGNRNIVESFSPSEMFAEEFSCGESNMLPASFVAAKPSEVMLIETDHILHTCSNRCEFHQRLIFNLVKALAQKAVTFHQKLGIVSNKSTREKLMAYLSIQSKTAGSTEFDIPFDRQELADYLNVDRSGLSVEIGKLKSEGILDCRKNHFLLL